MKNRITIEWDNQGVPDSLHESMRNRLIGGVKEAVRIATRGQAFQGIPVFVWDTYEDIVEVSSTPEVII